MLFERKFFNSNSIISRYEIRIFCFVLKKKVYGPKMFDKSISAVRSNYVVGLEPMLFAHTINTIYPSTFIYSGKYIAFIYEYLVSQCKTAFLPTAIRYHRSITRAITSVYATKASYACVGVIFLVICLLLGKQLSSRLAAITACNVLRLRLLQYHFLYIRIQNSIKSYHKFNFPIFVSVL